MSNAHTDAHTHDPTTERIYQTKNTALSRSVKSKWMSLTFEDFGHRNKSGDALGNFAGDDGEVVLDFDVGRRIRSRQYVKHELQQFTVLQSRLAAGL